MKPFQFINEKEIVELTQLLVRIPSDWNSPSYEKNALDALANFLDSQKIPYQTQKITDNRYNIIASFKGGKPGRTLLFNGHIDTVPAYQMDFPSHEAFIKDGWIYGRGANDMKGAVAAMIMTLISYHRSKVDFNGEILVSVVVGEEEDSAGTKQLVKEGIKADAAIVGEPSGFDYAIAHRGLEWLEIEVEGKTAHSGVADQGINAISKAAKIISALEQELGPKLLHRVNPFTGPSLLNFGRIEGGDQPSTVAGNCKIQLDRRYIPGETPESVRSEIDSVIRKLQAEDEELHTTVRLMAQEEDDPFHHVPLETDPNELIVKTVQSVVENVTGRTPELSTKRGWTDAGLLSFYGKIPTVVCGPGGIEYSHAKNEGIPISHLVDAVKIYSEVAWSFCQADT